MQENTFPQISLDLLRLHQHTCRTLLATGGCQNCQIHNPVYVTLDGRYYVCLPCMPADNTGILLIEDENTQARLSWVATAREVKQKESAYERVISALQHRMPRSEKQQPQASRTHLLELTPQQGRLTTGSKDLSLTPHDLVKALYPAKQKVAEFAL